MTFYGDDENFVTPRGTGSEDHKRVSEENEAVDDAVEEVRCCMWQDAGVGLKGRREVYESTPQCSSDVTYDSSDSLPEARSSEELMSQNIWAIEEDDFERRYALRAKTTLVPRRAKVEIAVPKSIPKVALSGSEKSSISPEPPTSNVQQPKSAVYVPKCLRERVTGDPRSASRRRSALCTSVPNSTETPTQPDTNFSPVVKTNSLVEDEMEKLPETRNSSPVIKIFCKLVAMHCLQDVPTGILQLVPTNGSPVPLEMLGNICIGQNVRCLVFRDLNFALCESVDADHFLKTGGSHLIFAFNWFSPKGVMDYMSLGLRLIANNTIDEETGMCGKFFVDKAREFLWHPFVQRLMTSLELQDTAGTSEGFSTPSVRRQYHEGSFVTVSGFSMGGGIAHAFAYLLIEEWGFRRPVRVVCFGSARPGSAKFTRWCESTLEPNSLNVILASPISSSEMGDQHQDVVESAWQDGLSTSCTSNDHVATRYFDPVTRTPKLSDGFDLHPWSFIPIRQRALLVALSTKERAWLRTRDFEGCNVWCVFGSSSCETLDGTSFYQSLL